MTSKVLDIVKVPKPKVDSAVKLAHDLKPYERRFLLSPFLWRNNPTKIKLDWMVIKFTKKNKSIVPEKKGVYMFVVSHETKWIPENNYIMYIGETGSGGNGRTLRDRYGDYLRDQKSSRNRIKINEMLNLWEDDISFVCSTVASNTDIKKLEGKLIECLIPPYNEGDIPIGEIKKAVKVLRI